MKLFLASEKFYDVPDSQEATVLLIMAPDKDVAMRNATYSCCPDEPRSVLTPMFDIWELGDFVPLPTVWDRLKDYPENETGAVTILTGYEPVEYNELESDYRSMLYANYQTDATEGNPFAYYDKLKADRDRFFSFTEKEDWGYREEEHLGFKVPVWVSPAWNIYINKSVHVSE